MKWKLLMLAAVTGLALSGCGNNNHSSPPNNAPPPNNASPAQVSYVNLVQTALSNPDSTAGNTTALINTVATPPGLSLATQACAKMGGSCQGTTLVQLTDIPATTDMTAFAGTQFPAVATPPGTSLATTECGTLGTSKCDPGLH